MKKKAASKKNLPAKHPFLKGMPPAMLQSVLKNSKKLSVRKGKIIFEDGAYADKCFLIIKGCIGILTQQQDVRFESESTLGVLQLLGAGEIVGWSWVIPPYKWRFHARAEESTELLVLDGKYLRQAMVKDHNLAYEIYKRLVPVMNHRLIGARLKLQMFGGSPFSTAEGG